MEIKKLGITSVKVDWSNEIFSNKWNIEFNGGVMSKNKKKIKFTEMN